MRTPFQPLKNVLGLVKLIRCVVASEGLGHFTDTQATRVRDRSNHRPVKFISAVVSLFDYGYSGKIDK